jgi:hypothetical protein
MQKGGKSVILLVKVDSLRKGLFVDRLKRLCFITGTVSLMFLAVLCIIGSVMGADWSKWFFTSPAGRGLWICIGLLIIAGLFEFKEIYKAKWPLLIYLGVLLVLAAGLINCTYTLFAGYIIGCIGLFGLFRVRPGVVDIVIAVLLFIVIVFIFYFRIVPRHPQLNSLFFVPHVFAYLLSYIFMTKAAFFAVKRTPQAESNAYRFVCMGFPLMTAGLALGSVWAAFAWGDWWSWDPKEMFSLALWLVFAAFLHFRYLYGQKFLRLNTIWIICGFILIILCLLWVNFSKIFAGLHSYAG